LPDDLARFPVTPASAAAGRLACMNYMMA